MYVLYPEGTITTAAAASLEVGGGVWHKRWPKGEGSVLVQWVSGGCYDGMTRRLGWNGGGGDYGMVCYQYIQGVAKLHGINNNRIIRQTTIQYSTI